MIAAELYAPPPRSTRAWVPAGVTSHGRLFRRPVLAVGELWHPVLGEIRVDLPLLHKLVSNFRAKLTGGHVAVQLPDHRGHRTEDPGRTVGEVVAMAVRGSELVADLDVRDPTAPLEIHEPAVTLHGDYVDTNTGRPAGPAVLGVHLVKTPFQGVSVDSNRTPGVRFKIDSDGVARPVVVRPGEDAANKLWASQARSNDAEIARLSAQAVEMGLSRPPAGTAPTTPVVSTARLVDRYVAQARDLGVTGPGTRVAPGSMPSLGR